MYIDMYCTSSRYYDNLTWRDWEMECVCFLWTWRDGRTNVKPSSCPSVKPSISLPFQFCTPNPNPNLNASSSLKLLHCSSSLLIYILLFCIPCRSAPPLFPLSRRRLQRRRRRRRRRRRISSFRYLHAFSLRFFSPPLPFATYLHLFFFWCLMFLTMY